MFAYRYTKRVYKSVTCRFMRTSQLNTNMLFRLKFLFQLLQFYDFVRLHKRVLNINGLHLRFSFLRRLLWLYIISVWLVIQSVCLTLVQILHVVYDVKYDNNKESFSPYFDILPELSRPCLRKVFMNCGGNLIFQKHKSN